MLTDFSQDLRWIDQKKKIFYNTTKSVVEISYTAGCHVWVRELGKTIF